MTRRMTPTAICFGLLLVAAAPAGAQELGLTILTSGQKVNDNGYFLFSDDNQAVRADLGLSVEVYEHLAAFAEYESGSESGTLFSDLGTDLTVYAARVGLVYRYPLLPFLHPYALVGAGAYWGDIDLDAPSQTYDDTAFGLGAFALAGLELIWYFGGAELEPDATVWDHFGLGITNDYGYTFGPTLHFDAFVPDGGGAAPVDLGEVSLSGFTWRVGLTIRYRL
jgi:hypothetical protein